MRKVTLTVLTMVVILFMAGCGSQSSVISNPPGGDVPVGMTVRDTPPNGVTVLFFELSITGASLTSQSGTSVSLLSSANPIPVNVSQLQTESAFLGSKNVPVGTYTSLSVSFANPQLTIYNSSGSAIGSCANNTVCQLTPAATPLTLNFSSSPFPVTLSANSPLAFEFDIHLNTIIQSTLSVDLSAANGVTLSQISPPSSGAPITQLGNLMGSVQNVGTNQFTLQSLDGRTFTINGGSSTTYSNFPSSTTCSADFSCLATGQVTKVTVTLQSDGTLLASEVDYAQSSDQQSVEGNIIGLSTSSGNTIMDLVVQQQLSSSLTVGELVNVTVPSTGVAYSVDWQGITFTPPSGVSLSFASASDLQVGQQVLVAVQGTVNTSGGSGGSSPVGPATASFTTDSITLEPSQIIGTVSAVNANSLSFTLVAFPFLFVPPSTNSGGPPSVGPVNITVQTAAATTFTNFTSLSGLASANVVSVDGWVFSTPTGATPITLAADQVILQTGYAVPVY